MSGQPAAYGSTDPHDLADLDLDRSDDLLRGGPGRKIRLVPTGRYSVEAAPKPYVYGASPLHLRPVSDTSDTRPPR